MESWNEQDANTFYGPLVKSGASFMRVRTTTIQAFLPGSPLLSSLSRKGLLNRLDGSEESQKGEKRHHGLTWVIEIPKGGTRKGKSWERKVSLAYGYIKEARASKDGEKVDFWMEPDGMDSELFFIINQTKKDGSFDEHKVMAGFQCEADAREGYLAQYPEDWDGLGSIKAMTLEQFREWLKTGAMKKEADEETKPLEVLQKAKAQSDRKNYGAKRHLLSGLFDAAPEDFYLDGDRKGKYVGVTHRPTGFRIHADPVITTKLKRQEG